MSFRFFRAPELFEDQRRIEMMLSAGRPRFQDRHQLPQRFLMVAQTTVQPRHAHPGPVAGHDADAAIGELRTGSIPGDGAVGVRVRYGETEDVVAVACGLQKATVSNGNDTAEAEAAIWAGDAAPVLFG